MLLTDYDSGIKFEFDAAMLGAVYNRGEYREVRTVTFDFYDHSEVYKVKELIPEILQMANSEKGG